MKIISYPNGIFGATTYLVYDENSKEAALVDCTSSVDKIKKTIDELNLNLKFVLLTHGHFDHVYCLGEFKKVFDDTNIFINKNDIPLIKEVPTQCAMAGVEGVEVPCIDGAVDEDTKNLKLGNSEIKILHTPGHSEGSVCYLIEDTLFSGDTLFLDSIGRCDLFGGSFAKIEKSIKEKLFLLDENIKVYPGHGEPTTIAHEKKYNPYFGGN